ncbi:MAG: hypothetical protein AAB557_03535 [Patescibacteria group bacterium]
MKLPRFIAHLWPVIIIVLAWTTVVLSNYTPGMWLTGWDNLHPEFDFFLNVKRSLWAVWQEYQGPGLLGGMGHAADLPRQLMLWVASIIIPAQLLRWAWTFFMLLAGPLGVYALVHTIVKSNQKMDSGSKAGMTNGLPALVAAIFYLFNLGTVQVFTAPFDAFVTHYGVLPWLLWSNWKFLHEPSKKTLLLVAIINIIGMTHAYIPTLFLVYLIILSILCIATLITSFHKKTFARIIALGFITFTINAFWLLPFTYFTLTKSSVTVGAKINTIATEEIYLQNKAFGDIKNVATLKSYWYDTADYNPISGSLEPVLGYWRNLERNNWIVWVRYTLAALILFGGVIALSQKHTRVWGALGVVAIGMVAVDTPPFIWMIDWLRNHIPLFSQFFRFPFTKWGTALALMYSVWLGIGISWMLNRLKTHTSKVLPIIVILVPITLSIIGSIGMLQGYLISSKFKRAIPNEYFQLFAKFKTLPPGRIANLPQNTYWGWTYYRWGYSGSGFLWYGIENPIMDRAFDVWTHQGEQYYWELSRALYSKDAAAVDAVLAKYDVRYVLLDESVVSPSSDRGLFLPETKELLAQMPAIHEVAQFGNLTLYERSNDSQSFVSLKTNLPTVSPAYGWTDNDVAFTQLGDYLSKPTALSSQLSARALQSNQVTNNQPSLTYPFRSLFTKRSINPLRQSASEASEREFTITETPDAITIGSISEATGASILKANQTVPASPNASQGGYDSTKSADLIAENVKPCGVLRDGTATATDENETIKPDQPSGTIPGIKQSKHIKFLRFTSRNQRGCLSFSVSDLPHRDGYLAAVESRHITGRPLLFSLINQTARHVELETYLPTTNSLLPTTSYFILPPLAPDGLGYTVYLSNDAIGRLETINDIKSIKFYRIPYREMVLLHSVNTQPQGPALSVDIDTVNHPNPAYYLAKLDPAPQGNQTLILSQSFDNGWKAYTINTNNPIIQLSNYPIKTWLFETLPFLFGTEIQDHVLVNNWENGWRLAERGISTNNPIENKGTIVIFFLPQLIQWFGFMLLPLPFLYALRSRS